MEDQSPQQKGKFKIVAFIGPMGVGKTTVANSWRAIDPNYDTVNFADGLRQVIELVYGIPVAEQKLEAAKRATFECLNGNTLRFALQHLGTEGFRTVSPYTWTDYFTRAVRKARDEGRSGVVVEDVRFVNEFLALRALAESDDMAVVYVPVYNEHLTTEWRLNASREARLSNRIKISLLRVFPALARFGLTAYQMHESERQMVQIFLLLEDLNHGVFGFDNSERDTTGELIKHKTYKLFDEICLAGLE